MKWWTILGADNIGVPFRVLLRSYLIANFFSLFLPSSFGGDIYRLYTLRKYNLDNFQNASSVLFDRISGLFALTSISIISYSVFYRRIINYYFLSLYLLSIIIFFIFSSERTIYFLSLKDLKIIKYIVTILKSFSSYKNNKSVLYTSLLISFLFHNNIILYIKLYCIAMNIDMDITYLYTVVPLIYLTEALPIAINGLGLREGAFIFFFMQTGKTMEEAMGISLLVITMRYLFALTIGGASFLGTLVPFNAASVKDERIEGTTTE
jgi:uncharacterized protein (TIRG00374 family)